jgi:hypothetical protein
LVRGGCRFESYTAHKLWRKEKKSES